MEEFGPSVTILKPYASDPPNVLRINYTPSVPHFTIRMMMSTILSTGIPSPPSQFGIRLPPTKLLVKCIERNKGNFYFVLLFAVTAAIPTFIIGILYMSLLKADNPGRLYLKGRYGWVKLREVTISTPVMFYAAEVSRNGILSYVEALVI